MFKWAFFAAFLPGMLFAQMPMGEVCRQGKLASDLNLSEAQQKQITAICKDSFKKVSDLRETWRKAEDELKSAFDESPVDQGKSNDAIEHLTAARSDLFRATSQMDLKIRTVLTDEQWQELKKRQGRGGRGRPGGPDGGGWRHGGPSTKSTAPPGQPTPNK
jgi:Spy/CpxP family protein refolding chaperone